MQLRTAKVTDWCAQQPHCMGNLGISRSRMPQIASEKVPEFLAWLESKGVKHKLGQKAVGALKATQKEINSEKVEKMRGKNLGGKPILVSKDSYVLDGHHRWAALLADDPGTLIRIIQVSLPIKLLLSVAHEFPGSFKADLEGKKTATTGFDRTAHVVAWRYILGS